MGALPTKIKVLNRSGLEINPATEEKQDDIINHIDNVSSYSLRLVESGSYTYVGRAIIGSSESSAVWQIKRIDESSGLSILWADANDDFDNVWNDYLTLTYL